MQKRLDDEGPGGPHRDIEEPPTEELPPGQIPDQDGPEPDDEVQAGKAKPIYIN